MACFMQKKTNVLLGLKCMSHILYNTTYISASFWGKNIGYNLGNLFYYHEGNKTLLGNWEKVLKVLLPFNIEIKMGKIGNCVSPLPLPPFQKGKFN